MIMLQSQRACPNFCHGLQTALQRTTSAIHPSIGSGFELAGPVSTGMGNCVRGSTPGAGKFISVYNQSLRSTQPGHPYMGRRLGYRLRYTCIRSSMAPWASSSVEAMKKMKFGTKGSLGCEDDARTSNTGIAQRKRAIPHSTMKTNRHNIIQC